MLLCNYAKDQIGLTKISIFQPINNTVMGTTTQNTLLLVARQAMWVNNCVGFATKLQNYYTKMPGL